MGVPQEIFARVFVNIHANVKFAYTYDKDPEPIYLTNFELAQLKAHHPSPDVDVSMWQWLNRVFPEIKYKLVNENHNVSDIATEPRI